eukprot:XP_001698981.1 predicted protein [Chlamydomonas reinhardtii]
MLSQQLARRQVSSARPSTQRPVCSRPCVRARIFRRDGPLAVEEVAVDEFNAPTKRQREQLKRTLQELGFTEQAADILAFSKITNSNCDLLIGDIRASFGVYQAPPPVGPVESVQNGVQDLLERLRLPFLGVLVAAGIFAAISNLALDELVDGLAKVPGLDAKTLANVQDAIDDFLFDLLQR